MFRSGSTSGLTHQRGHVSLASLLGGSVAMPDHVDPSYKSLTTFFGTQASVLGSQPQPAAMHCW